MSLEKIADNDYHNFEGAKIGVLVLLADWCQICKIYRPIVESVSKTFPDVRFWEVTANETNLGQVREAYHHKAYPTTLLIKDGEIASQKGLEGDLDYDELCSIVEKLRDGGYVSLETQPSAKRILSSLEPQSSDGGIKKPKIMFLR